MDFNRALIVEHNPKTRIWLSVEAKKQLGLSSVIEAGTIQEALNSIASYKIDFCILSFYLNESNTRGVLIELLRKHPSVYCVMLADVIDEKCVFEAFRIGARGCLTLDRPKHEIKRDLQGVYLGKPPLSPVIANILVERFHMQTVIKNKEFLSERRKEILTLLANGYQRKEIANILGISQNTVSWHLKTLYAKLEVSNSTEATLKAAKIGLVVL